MAKDINKDEFPEETKLKLDIFSECFREWFPVFLNNRYITKVYIYDFFAGSGTDANGNWGSPVILLNEAKGEDRCYCNRVRKGGKEIYFVFNENNNAKHKMLEKNIKDHMSQCSKENCNKEKCVYSYGDIAQSEFKEMFQALEFTDILKHKDYGKFILLDQYGFSQVDKDIFLRLVDAPKTDFIFFISSSFISRFKDLPVVKQYFNTENIEFNGKQPKECHRIIADYYKSLIPEKEYYLHHFTIKKGANYWGLIFGTNHTLGMEKFLKVCWRKDKLSGESNCNIDNDFTKKEPLFYSETNTNKQENIRSDIQGKILAGKIRDNISGLKYALKCGCLPRLFTSVVKDLEKERKIERIGSVNGDSTGIHNVKHYKIEIIKK
jgi:three-Cys-motif partner protein